MNADPDFGLNTVVEMIRTTTARERLAFDSRKSTVYIQNTWRGKRSTISLCGGQ